MRLTGMLSMRQFRLKPLALVVLGIAAGVWLPFGHADDLPPPPSAITMPDATLYLEPVVNGRQTGKVVPVNYRGGHYYMTPQQLIDAGLPVADQQAKDVAVDLLNKVDISYSGESQQLLINVPNDWLPQQRIGAQHPIQPLPAQSSLGMLFNYDVYANQSNANGRPGYLSAWSEQRLFDGFGVIANTGIFRSAFNGAAGDSGGGRYIRYDSQWHYNDDRRLLSLTAGDLTTGSLPWSSAVRIGGLQLSRNFAVRPDLITYPLPQFSGQAALPSSVDLYINSYKNSTTSINPGPFTLDSVPYINGAGQATVVTTDALGRQVSTTVPFYVASNLLQTGMSDFSVSAGALRRNYGIESADYGQWVTSASGRYGVTDWLTMEGRAEGAAALAVGGLGADFRVGQLGVFNASYSYSQAGDNAFDGGPPIVRQNEYDPLTGRPLPSPDPQPVYRYASTHGDQSSFGYTYSNQRFSLNAQRVLRSAGFGDISVYKSDYRLSRRTDQLTGSVSLSRLGSIGAGYFDVRDAIGQRTRLVNFSYSLSLWGNTSLYASVNREIGSSGYSAQLQLSIPFDSWGTASLGAARDNRNRWSERVSYSRAAPTDGGLGWNLAYADGQDSGAYRQADLTWRARTLEARAGMYGTRDDYNRWGEISGSLVAMNGGLYATNTINDAFALVSTQGYPDIPVRYENQLIGVTNAQGYLLVPTVTSYYHARFQIDPLTLPADVALPTVEKTVAIRDHSGFLVEFPIQPISAADVELVDAQGKPLANGSQVAVIGGNQQSYVGWDGMAYIDPVQQHNRLSVIPADGGPACQAEFSLAKSQGIQRVGPIVCR
ncbi:F1 capsule-anchoring protein precursor [Serratia entomophila]|nr:F1 capsule-anchoring protein precursor [Serratia entomophila]